MLTKATVDSLVDQYYRAPPDAAAQEDTSAAEKPAHLSGTHCACKDYDATRIDRTLQDGMRQLALRLEAELCWAAEGIELSQPQALVNLLPRFPVLEEIARRERIRTGAMLHRFAGEKLAGLLSPLMEAVPVWYLRVPASAQHLVGRLARPTTLDCRRSPTSELWVDEVHLCIRAVLGDNENPFAHSPASLEMPVDGLLDDVHAAESFGRINILYECAGLVYFSAGMLADDFSDHVKAMAKGVERSRRHLAGVHASDQWRQDHARRTGAQCPSCIVAEVDGCAPRSAISRQSKSF